MNTVFTFEPGDRISTNYLPGFDIPGIVVDDSDTPEGYVAVVYNDHVCSGVWFVHPQHLELVRKAEED